MTKRLLVSEDAHRIAKAKAAADNRFLQEWLEELIRRAKPRAIDGPRPARPRQKRAG